VEPITLCGLVIVMFGLWVEFEPTAMKVIAWLGKHKVIKSIFTLSTAPKAVYVRRIPVCVAKGL